MCYSGLVWVLEAFDLDGDFGDFGLGLGGCLVLIVWCGVGII